MATIAYLMTKLGMDNTQFSTAVQNSVRTIDGLKAAAQGPVNTLNDHVEKTESAFRRADDAAKKHLATVLKIGSAAVMLGVAVKAAYDADKAASAVAAAKGGKNAIAPPGDNLADSYGRVTDAVNGAYQAFGQAFSRSAGLAGALEQIANIVTNLTPLLETLGSAVGTVGGFLSSSGPLAFALVLALKTMTVAALAAAAAGIYLVKTWAIGKISTMLFGATPMVLAWRAALLAASYAVAGFNILVGMLKTQMTLANLQFVAGRVAALAWAAACAVANAAVTLFNNTLGVMGKLLTLIGKISFAGLGALGIMIGVVAAALYGLYLAWDAFANSSTKGTGETSAQMQKLAKSIGETREELTKLSDDLQTTIDTFGMTDAQKQVHKFVVALQKAGDAGVDTHEAKLDLDLARSQQGTLERLTKEENIRKKLAELAKDARQAGLSDRGKKLDDLRLAGANADQLKKAALNIDAADKRAKAKEREKDLAKEIADIEKYSREAGLSETEKRLAGLKAMGASAQQITAAQKQLAGADAAIAAAERKKQLANEVKAITKEIADLEFEAATAGLTAGQKKVEMAKRLGAQGEELARAQQAGALLDQANEKKRLADLAKNLTESTATPLEKYKKAVEDVQRLQRVGAINEQVARNALAAANKEFLDSSKGDSFKLESPTAVLRGSAEAALLANKQANPVDRLTQLQRDQLKEQQAIRTAAEANVIATRENRPVPDEVASFN